MDLSAFPMGETLHELNGRVLLPPLIRTPAGWVEVRPVQCAQCDGRRLLIGWTSCSCRTDTSMGGHRTWTCRGCGQTEHVGCLGEREGQGPMESYGCGRGLEPRTRTPLS